MRKWPNYSAVEVTDITLRQRHSTTQIKVERNRYAREVLEIKVGEKLISLK